MANKDVVLRGSCGEGRHPGLEETPPEPEGVLPHKHQIYGLKQHTNNKFHTLSIK